MLNIDCIGEICPIPVIKTKKALKEADNVVVLVDNEISLQNVEKFVLAQGYIFNYEEKIDNDKYFIITINKKAVDDKYSQPELLATQTNQVVIISSDALGQGDNELGKYLMKSFIYALTQMDNLPNTLIFYNKGVLLCADNSEFLPDLKSLSDAGVSIQSCGLCVEYFGLEDRIAIGQITNMYSIIDLMQKASSVIRP